MKSYYTSKNLFLKKNKFLKYTLLFGTTVYAQECEQSEKQYGG